MDLSGRGSMDLTEAARLMKQSSNASAVTNPAQLQAPPLMMMQQAVAMQQFQFQQALLMQQVMATQQAAARAATVKSAAEMAAARAAEISKQLKGSDAEEEEKKSAAVSPSRSKSASRSRSVSRSKSRSPIRYRRDRSHSRSPIRYRRDRPYSPSRSRDYYSYRSRSRRGYYRGRGGDYPWNPFRRDWDRDRDRDYYPRRRSRSRSRSRVRRRSRTRSRSPRFRRDKSASPRHRRDERKPAWSSRRSRSREVKRTPSPSSRSPSPTPGRKELSRSPRKVRESGSGANIGGVAASPVPRSERRVLKESSASPQGEKQNETLEHKDRHESSRKGHKQDQGVFKAIEESPAKTREVSHSPPASLSVSLNRSLQKDLDIDDELDVKSIPKKNVQLLSAGEDDDVGDHHPENTYSKSVPPTEDLKVTVSSPEASSRDENGSKPKGPYSAKHGSRHGRKGEYSSKDSGIPVDDESDEHKEVDDWRDDMKAHSREKERLKDAKKDFERKVEGEKRSVKVEIPVVQDLKKSNALQIERDTIKRGKKLEDDSDMETELPVENVSQGRKASYYTRKEPRRGEVLHDKEGSRSPVDEPGAAKLSQEKEREMDSDEILEYYRERVVIAVKADRTYEGGSIFEGPKLAGDEYKLAAGRQSNKEDYMKDLERENLETPVLQLPVKGDSDLEGEDDVNAGNVGPNLEEESMVLSRKGKEKQRPKDLGRRYEDEEERERRKDRHRKHRKKHKRKDDDEKEDEDEDKDEGEARKDKKRHKKKHRKEEDDEKKDRRKKKHRSRGKSVSDSAGESPRVEMDDLKDAADGSPIRRKSSSRHKKKRRGPSKSPANSATSSE